MGAVPAVGQHSAAIRAELGFPASPGRPCPGSPISPSSPADRGSPINPDSPKEGAQP